MKKILWFVIGLLIVLSLACGGSELAGTEAPAQPAATEAPPTAAPTEVVAQKQSSGPTIPVECLESEETFQACYDEGKIPPECINDEGSLKQECVSGAAQPAQPQSSEQPQPSAGGSGTMVADLGFRPEVNGFPFENYGGDMPATNLTPDEMRRTYGDQVCAQLQDNTCILTPPAAQFMEQWNGSMSGGHCFGFSVASLRFFQGQLNPADYGANSVGDLKLQNDEQLQREIAYSFIFQGHDTVRAGTISGAPNDVLDRLIEALNAKQDTYTIGFFKADGTGGHAVTPYAIEDRGNGTFAVLIYDNNYPKTPREMIFDRNANTWAYEASINPNVQADLYQGDANTQSLMLFPTSPGLQQQPCSFCAEGSQARVGGLAAAEPEFNEIWLDGDGDLLIMDEEGHKLGYDGGKLVSEIPGARYEVQMSGDLWNDTQEPVYYVPVNIPFNMTIDGSRLQEESATDIIVIGPGYDMGMEGIALSPGQQDNVIISTQDDIISYQTQSSESPNIVFGLQREGADYYFEVQGADMEGGGTINASLSVKDGDLIINATDLKADGNFGLVMTRIDDQGEESFYTDEINLKADGIVYVYFAEWKGNGTPVEIGIDSNGDGEVDEILSSEDEN